MPYLSNGSPYVGAVRGPNEEWSFSGTYDGDKAVQINEDGNLHSFYACNVLHPNNRVMGVHSGNGGQ